MKCVDCVWYWFDENEEISICHCPSLLPAPCEEEEKVEDYNYDYYEEEENIYE